MTSLAQRDLFARAGTVLRARRVSVIALAILAFVLALVMVTAIRSPLKDDVAWLLYVARRWLAGQRLYEDLVEVNPPLIVWLYAIPAAISDWLKMPPRLVAVPMFAAMVLGSAWWSAVLLQGRGPLFAQRTPVFAAIGVVLLVTPGVEFGQREHLMAASLLPYLCLLAIWLHEGTEDRRAALLAGVLAGLGCALKPTYGLAFVIPELLCLLRGRPMLRVAPLAAAAAAGLYGAAVLVFCPAFLTNAVPLALALYGGTDRPLWQLVTDNAVLFAGVGAIVVAWISGGTRLRRRGRFAASLYVVLGTFAIGAAAVYLMQGKNWYYHTLPAITATVLALVLFLAETAPTLRLALPRRSLAAGTVAACFALIAIAQADVVRMRPWVEEAVEPELSAEVRLEKIIRREKARTYIAFSEWIGLGFPVVNNTGVVWTSRFDSMWALKGELWRARQDGRAPAQWPIRHWVARDFVAGCPDLVVVDARGGLNYISILVASDAAFAEAWTHYEQIAAFDGLQVFKHKGTGCVPTRPQPQMAAADAAVAP